MEASAQELKKRIQELELSVPESLPDGFHHQGQFEGTRQACRRLSDIYLEFFKTIPAFLKADPILLGSWAREELCPKSDLDLGFVGPESEIQNFMSQVQGLGFKLRSRILNAEVIASWPLLEQLSLMEARPLTEKARTALISFEPQWKARQIRQVVKSMREDRLQRMKTFSIENVLEPHLKTGAGGLREVLHFTQMAQIKADLEVDDHVKQVMDYCRWFFLTLRFKLHAIGGQDYLQADLQIELARWFGFSDFRALMKQVQLCLSRSLFYSEWIQEWALKPQTLRKKILSDRLTKPEQLRRKLEKSPDIVSLYQIRQRMDALLTPKWIRSHPRFIEDWQASVFSWKSSEKVLRGFFRSRLADLIDPRLRLIVGYNQHDQYHAYTADAHILNLLIEFKSLVQRPSKAGGFKKIITELSAKDLSLLAWTCYYHDLGKGSSGPHEDIGMRYVQEDSRHFKRKKEWTEEVQWLVKNHLEFSKAAFRGDPNDETTFSRLFELKLTPERIRRLMVFTFLDIRATHPKAWTPWKERLLLDLYGKLRDPEKSQEIERSQILQKIHPDFQWTKGFLSSVPFHHLKADLKKIRHKREAVSFEFYANSRFSRKGFYWVRYFNPDNEKGVLLKALRTLFSLGCSVQQAFVFSLPIGVYDWFLVESPVALEALKKRSQFLKAEGKAPQAKAKWTQISLMSVNEGSWTLLFQGRDARGLLMNTVENIVDLGAEVKTARAQTWGRQVEDVIEIHPLPGTPEALVHELVLRMT